jgi:hypothetical protein
MTTVIGTAELIGMLISSDLALLLLVGFALIMIFRLSHALDALSRDVNRALWESEPKLTRPVDERKKLTAV